MRAVLLPLLLVAALSACALPPPNLTPAAVVAYNQTRLEKALDVIRDTAQDGSALTPPVVSVKDAVTVTKAHKSLVLIIESQGTGWQHQVSTTLDQLLANVLPATRAVLAPYVALVKALLQQVYPA